MGRVRYVGVTLFVVLAAGWAGCASSSSNAPDFKGGRSLRPPSPPAPPKHLVGTVSGDTYRHPSGVFEVTGLHAVQLSGLKDSEGGINIYNRFLENTINGIESVGFVLPEISNGKTMVQVAEAFPAIYSKSIYEGKKIPMPRETKPYTFEGRKSLYVRMLFPEFPGSGLMNLTTGKPKPIDFMGHFFIIPLADYVLVRKGKLTDYLLVYCFYANMDGGREAVVDHFLKKVKLRQKKALPIQSFLLGGMQKLLNGDHDGAISDLTVVIGIDPANAAAYGNRGGARFGQGDWKGAIADCTKAVELDPKFIDAYDIRAKARYETRDFKGAIADLSRNIELDPKNLQWYAGRAVFRIHDGQLEAAEEDCRSILRVDPKNAEAYMGLTMVRRDQGKIDDALTHATKVIEYSLQKVNSYGNRAYLRAISGDLKGALDDAEKMIELAPEGADGYLARGIVKRRLKDHAAAVSDLTRAIEIGPKSQLKYVSRGLAHYMSGDLKRALADFKKARDLEGSESMFSAIWMAIVLRLDGARDTALKELRRFVNEAGPSDGAPGDFLIARFLAGEAAEEEVLRSSSGKSEYEQKVRTCRASFYIGLNYRILGRLDEAKKHFLRSRETGARTCFEHEASAFELEMLNEKP